VQLQLAPVGVCELRERVLVAALASLMVALDVLVVSTALGAIRHHFGASLNELEWTVNAYGLTFAVLLIPPHHWATASAAGACSRPGWDCSWSARRCARCRPTPSS
jgi:hypothetical protein